MDLFRPPLQLSNSHGFYNQELDHDRVKHFARAVDLGGRVQLPMGPT